MLISIYNNDFSEGEGTLIIPLFGITILCPDSIPERIEWAELITERLAYIGIVADLEVANWSIISSRTWGYPGPYPVPTFDEGGFDALFMHFSWDLDVDMTGLFDTPSMPPNGDNFYQYFNSEMDWAISNYSQSFNYTDRIVFANEIQQLLYDDLPTIPLHHSQKLLVLDEELTGSFELLYSEDFETIENWEIPGETELHFAVPNLFEDFHNCIYRKSITDSLWLSQIYPGLVMRDPETKVWIDRLATSWSSNNGINYTIKMNPNAVFADGHVLNATDVNYTYHLLNDPAFCNWYQWWIPPYIDEDTIKIISEFELQFDFLQPYVFQENNFNYGIMPKHLWGIIDPVDQINQSINWALNDTLDSNIFGAGPYYLDDFDNSTKVIRLKRNEYFKNWTGIDPNFEYLYFEYYPDKESAITAYESELIDLIHPRFEITYDDLANLSTVTTTHVESLQTQELALNMLHPYFGTGQLCPIASDESAKHIRKAINYIIPRRNITQYITDNVSVPAATTWPRGSLGFNDSLLPIEYNLAKAWEHMVEAGFICELQEGTTHQFSLNKSVIILPLISGGVIITVCRRKKRFGIE